MNTQLGIIFHDGGGLMATMTESILIVLLILLTVGAVMAFSRLHTRPRSHLRANHAH